MILSSCGRELTLSVVTRSALFLGSDSISQALQERFAPTWHKHCAPCKRGSHALTTLPAKSTTLPSPSLTSASSNVSCREAEAETLAPCSWQWPMPRRMRKSVYVWQAPLEGTAGATCKATMLTRGRLLMKGPRVTTSNSLRRSGNCTRPVCRTADLETCQEFRWRGSWTRTLLAVAGPNQLQQPMTWQSLCVSTLSAGDHWLQLTRLGFYKKRARDSAKSVGCYSSQQFQGR